MTTEMTAKQHASLFRTHMLDRYQSWDGIDEKLLQNILDAVESETRKRPIITMDVDGGASICEHVEGDVYREREYWHSLEDAKRELA